MEHPLEAFGSYQAWLRTLDLYQDQIKAFEFFPAYGGEVAEAGCYAPMVRHLELAPYRHQAQAWQQLAAGENVVVATATASGKSLIYQLRIVEALRRGGRALILFPTKALARDQEEKLQGIVDRFGLDGVVRYDGDTPRDERARSRDTATCLLTNPDMVHYGILPFHERWAHLLGRLELMVIDELHSYRGVFGVHVANIVQRLLRLCRSYGAEPQVVATSATIGNPAQHLHNLTGLEGVVVADDGAPRAAREFLFWQPPEVDSSRRRSANTEAAALAATFVRAGVKTIFFSNSRKGAELLRRYAAAQLGEEARYLASYRAGYTAEDRRLIEAGFKADDIRVLTATSALELGVDVGGVDAVVQVGYPGSLMALRQRAGRAGRRGRRSLTLLIPGNDPLDEYYLRHPELITEGPVERVVADPFNSELHPLHLRCAAAERPLQVGEEVIAPWLDLASVPGLIRRGSAWHSLSRYPHRRVAVRGGGRRVLLRDGFGRRLGVADLTTALRELHPGAVYLHQGEPYLVVRLDLEAGLAELVPHIEDYYTQPRSETDIEVLTEIPSALNLGHDVVETPPATVRVATVRVTDTVTSFVRKRYLTEAILEERLLDLPLTSYVTQALWLPLGQVAKAVTGFDLGSAMHALEHTLIGLLPAFVLCERADVGGVSYPLYLPTGEPTVFVYDGYPGGVGYVRAGAAVFHDWLGATVQLLADCSCESGCPRCVLSPKCGNGNQHLDKGAALTLGRALLATVSEAPLLSA